jgi:hypothetical protein
MVALNKIQLNSLLPGAPAIEVSDALILASAADSLTAHADGGQSTGTPIAAVISRFTVVATAGDSVLLPPALPGIVLYIVNAAAASMDVFPLTGESINALAPDAAFAVGANTLGLFICAATGHWQALAA